MAGEAGAGREAAVGAMGEVSWVPLPN